MITTGFPEKRKLNNPSPPRQVGNIYVPGTLTLAEWFDAAQKHYNSEVWAKRREVENEEENKNS